MGVVGFQRIQNLFSERHSWRNNNYFIQISIALKLKRIILSFYTFYQTSFAKVREIIDLAIFLVFIYGVLLFLLLITIYNKK